MTFTFEYTLPYQGQSLCRKKSVERKIQGKKPVNSVLRQTKDVAPAAFAIPTPSDKKKVNVSLTFLQRRTAVQDSLIPWPKKKQNKNDANFFKRKRNRRYR